MIVSIWTIYSVPPIVFTLLSGGTKLLECHCWWKVGHMLRPEAIFILPPQFLRSQTEDKWIEWSVFASRPPPATLILSSMWSVTVASCTFSSYFCVLLSLVSLCDGTADAGFPIKTLYSTRGPASSHCVAASLPCRWLNIWETVLFAIYFWNRTFIWFPL